jgi:large subunit ribosomal protein L31
MRNGIHPTYRPVVYQDTATGERFLTRSTARPTETVQWPDGNTYPLVRLDTTAYSHPFWTGTSRVVDGAGAVEKFRRRYGDRRR